jgi:hypothetical protein
MPARSLLEVLSAATPAPPVGEALPAITQTTRARLLVLLAQGNIPGAIEMWKLHTGREAPKVLRAMQAAYGAANQVAGACVRVARDVHAGFRELGGKAQYLKFTPPGNTPYLGWEMKAGVPKSTIQLSDTGMHCAVQFKDRIYDAFTGPQGMLVDDYLKRLIAHGGTPVKQVVESL